MNSSKSRVFSRAMPSNLYVAKSPFGYKIGISNRPESRVKELGCSAVVVMSFEVPNSRSLELHLHDQFKAKNIGGEWFSLSECDIEILATGNFIAEHANATTPF